MAPALLLVMAAAGRLDALATGLAAAAAGLAYLPRLIAVRRFRQPLSGALGHPLGMVLLLAIQWHALVQRLLGRPAAWKGRSYGPVPAAPVSPPVDEPAPRVHG